MNGEIGNSILVNGMGFAYMGLEKKVHNIYFHKVSFKTNCPVKLPFISEESAETS